MWHYYINSNLTVLIITFSTNLEGILMHSLKSLDDPEVIILLVATTSLVDPFIRTIEESEIEFEFELKAMKK